MVLSFEQIRDLVRTALQSQAGANCYCYIVELYPDSVIYEAEGSGEQKITNALSGKSAYYKRTYAVLDGVVTLGEAIAVKREVEYKPLSAACQFMAAVESAEGAPARWKVKVIEFGTDRNGSILWVKEPLVAALELFNGAKVFALNSSQHQETRSKFGKSTRELVGALTNPSSDETAIYAELVVMPSAAWLQKDLLACKEAKIPYVYGLSVDISAKASNVTQNGKKLSRLDRVMKVEVDVVYDPAAGGQFLQLAAAVSSTPLEEEHMLKQLLAALAAKRPDLYVLLAAKVDDQTITEQEVLDQLSAAMSSPVATAAEEMRASVAGLVAAELAKQGGAANNEVQLLACKLILRDELTNSKLPEPVQAKLTRRFEAATFKVEDLRAAIKEEKETLDQLTASGVVIGAGDVRITIDSRDKAGQYLDDFFDGKVNSFRAAYSDITGDTRLTGDVRDAKRLTASLNSTSFAEILGDSLTRRMLAEYKRTGLTDWRKIVNVVPLSDFRTQHRTRMGGYGDLPTVGEGAGYAALASPSDDEATYAAGKKGGTEDLTLEMLRNDDAGAIRLIPVKLGRSASRTLYKFVFAFLDSNAAIYDGVALFHADHANLKTAALAKIALQAARLQMMKQTELGGNDVLGIPPRFIVVPADLEDTAYELTVAANGGSFTPTAADAIRRQTWEIIANPFWTDLNNWYLAADPLDIPGIEIGFLDGREEPELFIQDQPTNGSMFSNDKLTYKIRHIYGGAVGDYRGYQGNIVA